MQSESNIADSLRRVFYEGFSAQDVAEPLASFDLGTELSEVRSFMVDRPLTVIGLREHGLISHFLYQHDLDDRPLVEQARPITECTAVPTTTALHTVVAKLCDEEFVLVSSLGQPWRHRPKRLRKAADSNVAFRNGDAIRTQSDSCRQQLLFR